MDGERLVQPLVRRALGRSVDRLRKEDRLGVGVGLGSGLDAERASRKPPQHELEHARERRQAHAVRVGLEPALESREILQRAAGGRHALAVVDVERAAEPLLGAVPAEERERLRRGGGEPDADLARRPRRHFRPMEHEVLLHARQSCDPGGEPRRALSRRQRGTEDLVERRLELGGAQRLGDGH